jgi:hypothetical protein
MEVLHIGSAYPENAFRTALKRETALTCGVTAPDASLRGNGKDSLATHTVVFSQGVRGHGYGLGVSRSNISPWPSRPPRRASGDRRWLDTFVLEELSRCSRRETRQGMILGPFLRGFVVMALGCAGSEGWLSRDRCPTEHLTVSNLDHFLAALSDRDGRSTSQCCEDRHVGPMPASPEQQ